MSLTLNMVGGGSGGGISSNSALLVVYAPLGSIVTATMGSTTKTSKKGLVMSNRPTVEAHLFSISSSQFGTWTITATRETDTNSTTISITAVEQYELYIGYHVPLGEYQEVEYLSSSGTQRIYLNTDDGTGINGYDVDFAYNIAYTGNFARSIFGARRSNNSRMTAITSWAGTLIIVPPNNTAKQLDTYRHRVTTGEFFDWVCTYDGEQLQTGQGSQTLATDTRLSLFTETQVNASGGGTPTFSDMISSCKLYQIKLYAGQTLKFDGYPCYRLSDSVAGMYNKVNSTFYTNAGSGTFTVGADV